MKRIFGITLIVMAGLIGGLLACPSAPRAVSRGMAANQVGDGNTTDGQVLGATDGKIAFFGGTPVARRAAAAQATSLVGTASSTAITTDVKAAIIEIMNTLAAHNMWKGSA